MGTAASRRDGGLDRRTFVSSAVGAGAALVAGAWPGGRSASALAPEQGRAPDWAVGTRVPNLDGPDQYGVVRRLRDRNGRWRLLDVCTLWCGPCLFSARSHKELSEYVNASGVPFEIVSVVTEDDSRNVSDQRHAERWAERFHLDNDIVMHCGGDDGSPLRSIVAALAGANGQGTGGYPTYAIVDPSGVIQHYQTAADLDRLQAEIVRLTGAPLDRQWGEPARPLGRGGPRPALPAVVTATRSNGDALSERVPGSALIDLGADGVSLGAFIGDVGFGLDDQITVTFGLTDPPDVEHVYRFGATPDVSLGRATSELPSLESYRGSATLAATPDGAIELSCAPFRPFLPADADDHQWQFLGIDVRMAPVTALSAVELLDADVAAEPSLSPAARNGVRAALDAVRARVLRRDFDEALRRADIAKQRLDRTASRIVHFHVDSLIRHLDDVVATTH